MKVVLFNTAIGTSNLGDYIIYNSAKTQLDTFLRDSFVIEYGTHLKNLGILHYLLPSSKRSFSESCDYKLILGTNLLTTNMIRSIRQWPVGVLERKLYKNCIMVGVGSTYDCEQMDPLTKKLYREILRKDIVHSVRDEKTKRILESIPGVKAINTGCPSLWGLSAKHCESIPKEKAENVIVSISGYKSQLNRQADQRFISIIEKCYKQIYLWVQTTEDMKYFYTLNHEKSVKEIFSLSAFRDVCVSGKCDYVGTRLHGGILAIQNGVRSLVIEIDHRAREMHQANGIPTVKRGELDELEERLNSSWETRLDVREHEVMKWKSQFQ